MSETGIPKGLKDVATELRAIKNVLSCIWGSRYQSEETDRLSPEIFSDEYISTEECAKRLNVSDQTIRNWIATGKTAKGKGWTEGIHYINITPDAGRKAVIRIPWNQLILSFSKNREVTTKDFSQHGLYKNQFASQDQYV